MKVKALADLSGRPGDRAVGEEFEVSAAYGKQLIAEGLAEAVPAAAVPAKATTGSPPARAPAGD
ncbi:hypothetical protein D3C80_2097690 [compost metagenome]